MPRPHREILSQRLAVARSQVPAPLPAPPRSWWWTVGIVVVGWVLLVYPTLLVALFSVIIMTGSLGDTSVTADVAQGVLGLLVTLAMAAFPVLLGLAVKTRRRGLWISAIAAGLVSIVACIYIIPAAV